jgi:hypothetical protein
MKLFLVTAKNNLNISDAKFTKGMSVEVQTNLTSPFNNSGEEVIAAFVRKYGINDSRLNALSQNNFDVKKLS